MTTYHYDEFSGEYVLDPEPTPPVNETNLTPAERAVLEAAKEPAVPITESAPDDDTLARVLAKVEHVHLMQQGVEDTVGATLVPQAEAPVAPKASPDDARSMTEMDVADLRALLDSDYGAMVTDPRARRGPFVGGTWGERVK
jgi:hypothetical protein